MWSALKTSTPHPEVENGVQSHDSFFGELLKENSPNLAPPPPLIPKKATDTETIVPKKSASQEVEENDTEWDVDGWEVSPSTPQPKPIHIPRKQTPMDAKKQVRIEELSNVIMEELREYMLNFGDPRATMELNEDLNEKSFSSLVGYYLNKPELAIYTIEQEVPRMQYEVTCSNGEVVSCGKNGSKIDLDKVVRVLQRINETNRLGDPSPDHILLRMANQSLLADFLSSLSDYLIKPELFTAVVVADVSFNLDLENYLLICDAVFEVSTISSKGSSSNRVVLGSLPASITVTAGIAQDLVYEFKRPELRVVLDDQLRLAARAIAEQRLEERDMFPDPTPINEESEEQSPERGLGLLSLVGLTSTPSTESPPPTPPTLRLYNLDTPTK